MFSWKATAKTHSDPNWHHTVSVACSCSLGLFYGNSSGVFVVDKDTADLHPERGRRLFNGGAGTLFMAGGCLCAIGCGVLNAFDIDTEEIICQQKYPGAMSFNRAVVEDGIIIGNNFVTFDGTNCEFTITPVSDTQYQCIVDCNQIFTANYDEDDKPSTVAFDGTNFLVYHNDNFCTISMAAIQDGEFEFEIVHDSVILEYSSTRLKFVD